MEYIFGYILAMSATGTAPSAEQVEEVVISLGVEVDQAKLRRIITRFHDQDIRHVINQVKEDMLWTQSSSAALDGLLTIINNNETILEEKNDMIRSLQSENDYYCTMNRQLIKKSKSRNHEQIFPSDVSHVSDIQENIPLVSPSTSATHGSSLVLRPPLSIIQAPRQPAKRNQTEANTNYLKKTKQISPKTSFQGIFGTSKVNLMSHLVLEIGNQNVFINPRPGVIEYVQLKKEDIKDNSDCYQIWVGRVRNLHQGCEVIDRNLFGFTIQKNVQVAAFDILQKIRRKIHFPLTADACSSWTDFREGLFVRVDEVFPIDIFMLSDYVSKQVKFDLKKNHKGLGTLKSETAKLLMDTHQPILNEAMSRYYEYCKGLTRHAIPDVDMNNLPKPGFTRTDEDKTCPYCKKLFATVQNKNRHLNSGCDGLPRPKNPHPPNKPSPLETLFSSTLPRPTFDVVFARTLSTNSRMYCGGLGKNVSQEYLRSKFSEFGQIKVLVMEEGSGFAFIEYEDKHDATKAIINVNNTVISGNTVICSWAK